MVISSTFASAGCPCVIHQGLWACGHHLMRFAHMAQASWDARCTMQKTQWCQCLAAIAGNVYLTSKEIYGDMHLATPGLTCSFHLLLLGLELRLLLHATALSVAKQHRASSTEIGQHMNGMDICEMKSGCLRAFTTSSDVSAAEHDTQHWGHE